MRGKRNQNTEDILSMIREGISNTEIAEAYGFSSATSVSWIKTKYKKNVKYAIQHGDTIENAAKAYDISVRTAEWLNSLPECERGQNLVKKEEGAITTPTPAPKKEYGRVTKRSKIGVKVIQWNTEELLEMIEEDGYYVFDVSDPAHPEVKLLNELSLKEFKRYSENPAAVLIQATPKEEKTVAIVKQPVIEKIQQRTVGVSSPAFENKFDDWRDVPTPIVCQ